MEKAYEKMKRKAHALHDFIQTNRLEWLQHRSVYNQMLMSCYDRFKKTISASNADMRKAITCATKQDTNIATVKGRLLAAKHEIKTGGKIAEVEEKNKLKSSYEVSIWTLKSDKNKLSGQGQRLEVGGRSGKSVATGEDESIEMFARKLELK